MKKLSVVRSYDYDPDFDEKEWCDGYLIVDECYENTEEYYAKFFSRKLALIAMRALQGKIR